MSILIRGMKMPKSCTTCRFSGFGGLKNERIVCMFTGTNDYLNQQERFPDCPLVPVPSHGRLIDADALKNIIETYLKIQEDWAMETVMPDCKDRAEAMVTAYINCIKAIEKMPTIIGGGDMTIDEAIKDIRDCVKPVVGGISLDMAIKALEKEQEAIINISKTIKVVTTNADRIRNMTDEELAKKFAKSCIGMICKNGKTCYDCWLEWLKQETGT